jgi:hypothetical protein
MSKLTQEELFIALAKGRKVRKTTWKPEHYIYLFNGNIINQDSWVVPKIDLDANWELYIETVSFFEALEAMKNGKRVKRVGDNAIIFFDEKGFAVTNIASCFVSISKNYIDARWQILEGDNDE